MAQSNAPPIGRRILTSDEMRRALVRISHEILERNGGADDLVIVGLHSGGVPIAHRIAEFVKSFEGKDVPVGSLDIGLYRDDLAGGARPLMRPTHIPAIQGLRVVLVDDVLYTGRSIRAAMDALLQTSEDPARSSSPCSSTAATASFPSEQTTWARTSRPPTTRRWT